MMPRWELLCNNRCGVFGTLYHNPSAEEAIPMALKQEIQTGAAQILCTVSGDTPKAYDITLEEIDYSGTDSTRNMTVCITDPELLEVTGGIVQGMSGSPILQNGKLVGAVTHVFVDDPTRGYGIFCEHGTVRAKRQLRKRCIKLAQRLCTVLPENKKPHGGPFPVRFSLSQTLR